MKNRSIITSLLFLVLNGLMGFALILLFAPTLEAQAINKAKTPHKAQNLGTKPQLGTSFKFTGSSLRGKYNTSMSLRAAVENDKLLEDLLNGRTEFEDRIKQDQQRN